MNSEKTAITRTVLSAPARYLLEQGLLRGRVLDYGCGKCFDADWLGVDGYDPHYRNIIPDGKYNTIICIYVINTVKAGDADFILQLIGHYLVTGGTAYIAVRRDIKKEGVTKRGTYQRNVKLEEPYEVIRKTSGFCIYKRIKK